MTVRSLLKKGVMLAVFNGRGSVHGSKENFTGGIGENTINSVNDVIDAVLALHEAGRTTVRRGIFRMLGCIVKGIIHRMWWHWLMSCSHICSRGQ